MARTVPNFAIDGTPISPQPSTIEVRQRRPPTDSAVNGGSIGVPWTNGRTVIVTWGRGAAKENTVSALITARNGLREHTFTWDLPDDSDETMKVDWAYGPEYTIIGGQALANVHIECDERPD